MYTARLPRHVSVGGRPGIGSDDVTSKPLSMHHQDALWDLYEDRQCFCLIYHFLVAEVYRLPRQGCNL